MTARTRAWLRSFIQLGARRGKDDVPVEDVERQEDTVLRALELLERQPGLVLADEVGMGKTFEALGIIAALCHERPGSRICIVTPGPDLNRKWLGSIAQCSDSEAQIYDFTDRAEIATTLAGLISTAHRREITLVPLSVFQSARGGADEAYLLSLFARWKGLHGATCNAMFRRFRGGKLERVDPSSELFLDTFDLSRLEPHLSGAFQSGNPEEPGLDEIFEAGGIDSFEIHAPVRYALDVARFRLVRALMPDLELLVIDEAHKLKNPESLRHRGIATVFDKKYDRALFLTATPFQLDIAELRQVFSLFARARAAPASMTQEVDALFASISDYQEAYDRLERCWRDLDPAQAAIFAEHYRLDPNLERPPGDLSLVPLTETVRVVQRLKRDCIEPGFRRWMVRSIHHEKRQYRHHAPRSIDPEGESLLPFLVYERFIAELFRTGDSTHKAAVEVNMVSSFEAAAHGNLFAEDRELVPAVEEYRRLLQGVLASASDGLRDHPKLSAVVADALGAAERGDKTLVFCARTQTISKLRAELDERWEERVLSAWRAIYPAASPSDIFGERDEGERGYLGRFRDRLHAPRDALYLALRERHLQTLVPASRIVFGREEELATRATELLQTLRVNETSATRIDYKLAKRCVEQAVVELWTRLEEVPQRFRNAAETLMRDEYLRYGLDLTPDDLEGDDQIGTNRAEWKIAPELVERIVNTRPHLWQGLATELDQLRHHGSPDLVLRVRVVERLARYLTRRDVLFVPELLGAAQSSGIEVETISSQPMLEFIDEFWGSELGARWISRLREFLRYLAKRPRPERLGILDGPIAQGEFVRHTVDGESREGVREAFNTPLHPMVLIANEVMQEGLDLHHNCRRLIHHDLAWNPAQLEQRVGRIDRLGSLVRRLRQDDPSATLEVHYPLITRTIDERMYRTVKTREKWLEFLLGARPSFNEFSLDEQPVAELPAGLAESLAVDLRPARVE